LPAIQRRDMAVRERRRRLNTVPPISPEDVRPWEEVRRSLRLRRGHRSGRNELVGLVLVLAVWLGTAWWATPRVEVELSTLVSLPEELGFVRNGYPPHPLVGYDTSTSWASARINSETASAPL
jgi:hypothetical protein